TRNIETSNPTASAGTVRITTVYKARLKDSRREPLLSSTVVATCTRGKSNSTLGPMTATPATDKISRIAPIAGPNSMNVSARAAGFKADEANITVNAGARRAELS